MVVALERTAAVAVKRDVGTPPEPPRESEQTEEGTQFKNEIVILVSAPLLTEALPPKAVEALSVQTEVDAIVAVLERARYELGVTVSVKIATTEAILEILASKERPLVVHFIGHGMRAEDETALILEDDCGLCRPFSATDLLRLLRGREKPLCQLAILNACHSQGLADALIENGVSHVIAVNAEDRILDIAARTFAKHFYAALLNNQSIQNAFEHSRSALMVDDSLRQTFSRRTFRRGVNLDEAYKFHLLPQNSVEHNHGLKYASLTWDELQVPRWEKTNLASDDITFVGRRHELHEIVKSLKDDQVRCISLTGMGGMGKTALAEAVGRWQFERNRWRDGVWMVELRGINSSRVATELILAALFPEEQSQRDIGQALKGWKGLLILDDLDLLINSDSEGLSELLNGLLKCRNLKTIVTSRLDLPSEVVYRRHEIQELTGVDAMDAFRRYAPLEEEWRYEDASVSDLEDLMEVLDGYPLPIKLVADYMKLNRFGLQDLCQQLQRSPLKTFTNPPMQKKRRENNLAVCLDLTYNSLPPGAKDFFPVLALFPSGLTRALAKLIEPNDGSESLAILLQCSMAEQKKTASTWRVVLPEPARLYAETKQIKAIDDYAPQVLAYFYEWVRNLHERILREDESNKCRKQLLEEQSNLSRFLQWSYGHEKPSEGFCCTARLAALLGKYWKSAFLGTDPLAELDRAFALAKRVGDLVGQADVQASIGSIQLNQSGIEVAEPSYRQAIQLYQAALPTVSDPKKKAEIHRQLGEVWTDLPDWAAALSSYEQAYRTYESAGERLKAARSKLLMGELCELVQDPNAALEHYEQAKMLFLQEDFRPGISRAETSINKLKGITSNPLGETLVIETPTVDKYGEIIRVEPVSFGSLNNPLGGDVSLEMVVIPGGSFDMGSPEQEEGRLSTEGPLHRVQIQAFRMSRTPITQAQWRLVAAMPLVSRDLDSEPSHFKGDGLPVECVSWYDAVEFCNRLSQYIGEQYRLPTEAEWEYACRAGTDTPFAFGETITTKLANFDGNSTYGAAPKGTYRKETTDVGSFPANAYSLCDMHGNVWEWCQDTWHENYNGAPIDGSAWIGSDYHILRGGSWYGYPVNCRCASRYRFYPGDRDNAIGFRVVCAVPRHS
jgi:formylglycine-generating enzyme required for sulfatase activity